MKIRFLEKHRIRTFDRQEYDKGEVYDLPVPAARFFLMRKLAVPVELETATAKPVTEKATIKAGVRTVGTEDKTDDGSGN